jgi:hypothetical protein
VRKRKSVSKINRIEIMTADIDPQLKRELDSAGDDGEVEAVILVQSSASAQSGEDIIRSAANTINETPSKVKSMPGLGAIFVRGSGRLVRTILESEQVVSATSAGGNIHKASE